MAAGKAVFVEWPLAENADRAAELAALAREGGQQTIIGLQARVAPVIRRAREIVTSGELGKVLSSAVNGYAVSATRAAISAELGYFYDRKVGGNFCTIMVGHSEFFHWDGHDLLRAVRLTERGISPALDFVHAVLGEFASFHAHTQLQRPDVVLVDRATGAQETRRSDVPDLVAITGTFEPSAHVAEGASLAFHLRYEPPFPGTKPFVWTISFEHGEMEISSERSVFLNSEASASPISLRVHTFATGEVQTEELKWEDWQEELPARGRNIAMLYDLYADGKLPEAAQVDFELAVRRHKELDSWLVPSS